MRERVSTSGRTVQPKVGAAFVCAAFVLLGLGSFVFAGRALAQSPIRVTGAIHEGTANAPAANVAGLTVTLFQVGSSGPVSQTVETDSHGRFSFDNLSPASGSSIFTSVDYRGIHYFSDVLTPDVAASSPISLTVYETSPMPADFTIDGAHVVLEVGQKLLNGVELIQLTNTTDRVFMVPLPLPQNASAVQFNDPRDEFRSVRGPDGSLSYPVLPSTSQVLLGVELQTRPPDYTLKLNVPVKLGQLDVLVPQDNGVQASSPELQTGQPFSPQHGSTYTQLASKSIPANSAVNIAISNLPGADNSNLVRNEVLAAGGLAALGLLALGLVRRRTEPAHVAAVTADERVGRLQAIAALDDAFQSGELDEQNYLARRAVLKAELLRAGPISVGPASKQVDKRAEVEGQPSSEG